MKIVLHDDFGGEHDVTEHVKELFDQVTTSMEWGSDFFSTEEQLNFLEIGFMAGFTDISKHIEEHQTRLKGFKRRLDEVPEDEPVMIQTIFGRTIEYRHSDPLRTQVKEETEYLEGLENLRKKRAALLKLTDDVTDFDEEG